MHKFRSLNSPDILFSSRKTFKRAQETLGTIINLDCSKLKKILVTIPLSSIFMVNRSLLSHLLHLKLTCPPMTQHTQ